MLYHPQSTPRPLDQFPGLDEADLRTNLLVEHLGFSPEEATAYLSGDSQAIAAVAERRMQFAESVLGTTDNETDSRL